MNQSETFLFPLQDLVDFCKDIGLQSSAAATRNATIKLIGVLHKFVGPGDLSAFSNFHMLEIFVRPKVHLPCRY